MRLVPSMPSTLGKVDVHEDDVGRVFCDEPERLLDVRRGADALEVGLRVDRDGHGLGEREVIVDDQHPLCHVRLRSRSGPCAPSCDTPPPMTRAGVRAQRSAGNCDRVSRCAGRP